MPPKRGSANKKKIIMVNGNEQINAVATKVTNDVNQLIEEDKNDSDKVINDVNKLTEEIKDGSDMTFPSQETPREGEGLETTDYNDSSRMNDSIVSERGDIT